jgi:hypothetical protein
MPRDVILDSRFASLRGEIKMIFSHWECGPMGQPMNDHGKQIAVFDHWISDGETGFVRLDSPAGQELAAKIAAERGAHAVR